MTSSIGSRHSKLTLHILMRGEQRYGFLSDAQGLVDVAFPGNKGAGFGDIVVGKITTIDQRLGGAFVTHQDGEGFLPNDAALNLTQGAYVLAQVVRAGSGDKAPRLSTRIKIPGFFMVYGCGNATDQPQIDVSRKIDDPELRARLTAWGKDHAKPGETILFRSAAVHADPQQWDQELDYLRFTFAQCHSFFDDRVPGIVWWNDPALALLYDHGHEVNQIFCPSRLAMETLKNEIAGRIPALEERIVLATPSEVSNITATLDDALHQALDPQVPLAGGGEIYFEPGRRVTVIDVDLGAPSGSGFIKGEQAIEKVNLAAVTAIARQLRLRHIGGLIIIDFIDMASGPARAKLMDALRRSLAVDPVPTRVGRMGDFGLVPLTRQRRGPALADHFSKLCNMCGGEGQRGFPGLAPFLQEANKGGGSHAST